MMIGYDMNMVNESLFDEISVHRICRRTDETALQFIDRIVESQKMDKEEELKVTRRFLELADKINKPEVY